MISAVQQLANVCGAVPARGPSGLRRVQELLDQKPEVTERRARRRCRRSPRQPVRVRDFRVPWGEPVLNGVELNSAGPEDGGHRGQSGSGKSTLLACSWRFHDPTRAPSVRRPRRGRGHRGLPGRPGGSRLPWTTSSSTLDRRNIPDGAPEASDADVEARRGRPESTFVAAPFPRAIGRPPEREAPPLRRPAPAHRPRAALVRRPAVWCSTRRRPPSPRTEAGSSPPERAARPADHRLRDPSPGHRPRCRRHHRHGGRPCAGAGNPDGLLEQKGPYSAPLGGAERLRGQPQRPPGRIEPSRLGTIRSFAPPRRGPARSIRRPLRHRGRPRGRPFVEEGDPARCST